MRLFVTVILSLLSIISACSKNDGQQESTRQAEPQNGGDGSWDTNDMISSDSGNARLILRWEPQNLRVGKDLDHTAHIVFFNASDETATSARIEKFDVHMPSMGHGTDTQNQEVVTTAEPFRLNVIGVSFIMLGDDGEWKVTIDATINDAHETWTVDIPKVGR